MSKFLVTVTGATGRLGVPIVEALQKHFQLRLLARNAKKARQMFQQKKIVEIDLETAGVAEIQCAVRGSWAVVHLAGLVDLCASRSTLFSINYEATRKLVRACEREHVPVFLYCSSISVYADSKKKTSEDALLRPTNAYGQSKLAAETAVTHSDLKWVSLRPGIIYGAHFTDGFTDVIEQMKAGRARVIGNGKNFVPLVYEGDVAKAFVKCLQLLKSGNTKILHQAFNVVGEKEPTQKEALQVLANTFGLRLPRRSVPLHFAVAIAKLHSLYCSLRGKKKTFPPEYVYLLAKSRIFDVTKAKKMLKFTASTPLEKGLREMKKSWEYG